MGQTANQKGPESFRGCWVPIYHTPSRRSAGTVLPSMRSTLRIVLGPKQEPRSSLPHQPLHRHVFSDYRQAAVLHLMSQFSEGAYRLF